MVLDEINVFVCPECRASFHEPEHLCAHMEEAHHSDTYDNLVTEVRFSEREHAEYWIGKVESHRNEGGMVATKDGSYKEIWEHYILCSEKASPQQKRRRVDYGHGFIEKKQTLISCTAFVHAFENDQGTVSIRYCLKHAADCEMNEANRETVKCRKRNMMRDEYGGESSNPFYMSSLHQPMDTSSPTLQRMEIDPTRLPQQPLPFDISRFLIPPVTITEPPNNMDTENGNTRNMSEIVTNLADQINHRLWENRPTIFPRIY